MVPTLPELLETRGPPTPEDELVAIGLPAVPALIGALSDLRFTRKLDHSSSYKGQRRDSWRVMRVNDVAYGALRRLAAGALPEFGGHGRFPAGAVQPAPRRRVSARDHQGACPKTEERPLVMTSGLLRGAPPRGRRASRGRACATSC